MLDIEDFKKKLPKKSRLMGIDPGGKRVGIAISDENKIIATPYTTLIKNKYSDFVKELIEIVNENKIKGIVIGNPINMDGSSSQSSQSARDLANNRGDFKTNLPNVLDCCCEIREASADCCVSSDILEKSSQAFFSASFNSKPSFK